MEENKVQPKRRGIPCLGWLGIGIVVLIIILLLMRSCNNNNDVAIADDTSVVVGATTPTALSNDTSAAGRTPGAGNYEWNDIDQNAPAASYNEVTDKNIGVRSSSNYGIYSLGSDILFDLNKTMLRPGADKKLQQIASSINKRFKGGEVRIYGYADSTGSAAYNKQLAEERAATVRNWLAAKGGIDSSKISLHPIGEGRPVATNNTAQGREQNRRVEIVARKP